MKKTRLTLIAVVWTLSLVGVGLWAQGTAASPQQSAVVPQGLGDRRRFRPDPPSESGRAWRMGADDRDGDRDPLGRWNRERSQYNLVRVGPARARALSFLPSPHLLGAWRHPRAHGDQVREHEPRTRFDHYDIVLTVNRSNLERPSSSSRLVPRATRRIRIPTLRPEPNAERSVARSVYVRIARRVPLWLIEQVVFAPFRVALST